MAQQELYVAMRNDGTEVDVAAEDEWLEVIAQWQIEAETEWKLRKVRWERFLEAHKTYKIFGKPSPRAQEDYDPPTPELGWS